MYFPTIVHSMARFLEASTTQISTPGTGDFSVVTNFISSDEDAEPAPMAGAADVPAPPATLEEPERILDGVFGMEAYFSWDGQQIIFQGAASPGRITPHVYTWKIAKKGEKSEPPKALVTSNFDCECTYFSADGRYIIYNTNPHPKDTPLQEIDFGGYPYLYDPGKETFLGRFTDEGLKTERLTDNNTYEAETSFSPPFRNHAGYPKDGVYLLFTSSRTGSLDLYVRRILDSQGERVAEDETVQITNTPTLQEGGAFFMPDGRIVYRAWEFDPKDPQKEKWERNGVNYRPMHLYTYDPASKQTQQLTTGENRNWSPYPHPDGNKIVFAKRDFSQPNSNFDIFVLHLKDGHQERITQDPHFDGYPVFHPKGDRILFSRYLMDEHRFQLMQVPYKGKK